VRIFKGGSSVRAPGRGGRRRRTMIVRLLRVEWMAFVMADVFGCMVGFGEVVDFWRARKLNRRE